MAEQRQNGTPAAAPPSASQTQASVMDEMPDAFANHSGSPALQQMSHLGVYLQDCDDEARLAEMIQCLRALPHQTLMHAAQNLKKRAYWLSAEEATEFERAEHLKVLAQPEESSDNTSAEPMAS